MKIDNEGILGSVKKFLVNTASDLLKICDMEIDNEMEQYGFDSISYTEFANKINDYYDIDLMPTVVFDLEESTIRSLAYYLCDKYARELHYFYGEKHLVKESSPVPVRGEEAVKTSTYSEVQDINKKINKTEAEEEIGFDVRSRFIHPEKKDLGSRFIHKEKKEKVSHASLVDREHEPIAIIGMQGRFPQSETIDEFWANLQDAKELITEVPLSRFDWKAFDDPALRWGSFMKDVDKFDADFFGIVKSTAELMDPQHRLFLETAWSAIEDAGYKPSELSGTKTGVFIGIGTRDYSDLIHKRNAEIMNQKNTADINQKKGVGYNIFTLSDSEAFMLCNRISSMLNIHGPSEAIDTKCSSSLIAIHKAVESIHLGSSEMAIVGGVNVILTPSTHMIFSEAGMLSKTGKCRVFDKDADGTIRSEGVGAIILKPLSAAVRDGDHIYALIKGTSQNHKGKSASLIAPNANAEADLIKDVFRKAKVDPSTVNYIEAHSTGTKLGDPIEIIGLKKAFEQLYRENGAIPVRRSCAISSLKGDIGHLETAAGIVALIKVILSLKENQILGVSNFNKINPYIDLTESPFYINTHNKQWDRVGEGIPRRAGISAFGYGGVNAHVIIEEYMEEKKEPIVNVTNDEPAVIVLSARNRERLKEQAKLLYEAIDKKKFTDSDLANIAYTLQVGRKAFDERLAFIAVSINEVREKLSKYIQDENDSIYVGRVQKKNEVVTMLEQDKGIDGIVNSWIINREYNKLLWLWVSGWQINWEMRYKNRNLKRVSLPTYPFEKKSYWINFNSEESFSGESSKKNNLQEQSVQKVILRAEEDERKKTEAYKLHRESVKEIIEKVFTILLCVDVRDMDENIEITNYGVDSIILTQLVQQLQDIDPTIDFETLFNCKTIHEIIAAVKMKEEFELYRGNEEKGELEHKTTKKQKEEIESLNVLTQYPELIKLNKLVNKRPVFWFHGGFGGVEIYRVIGQNLKRPFYGIQAKGYLTDMPPILGIEEMAVYYVKIIKSVQKEGPYDLGGLSMGGIIAYEVARQLQELGDKVSSIVMIESIYEDKQMTEAWQNIPMKGLKKERMLRAVNLLLGFSSSIQLDLISEVELNVKVSDEEFLEQLISLCRKKGSNKTPKSLRKFIQQLESLLHTLDVSASIYGVPPLDRPDEVDCYYFCNKNGALFKEEDSQQFFQILDRGRVFDFLEISKKWNSHIPGLVAIKIESSSHFTVLSDTESQKVIMELCTKLYSDELITDDFLAPYLLQ